jgi:hypothetical protein
MRYDVTIDKELFSVYPEIRLGLLRFHADVKAPEKLVMQTVQADCVVVIDTQENLGGSF